MGLSPGFWSTTFSGPMAPVSPGGLPGQTSSVSVGSAAWAAARESPKTNAGSPGKIRIIRSPRIIIKVIATDD